MGILFLELPSIPQPEIHENTQSPNSPDDFLHNLGAKPEKTVYIELMKAGMTHTGFPHDLKRRSRESGMSLIEVAIALGVVTIAVFAFMSTLFYSIRVKESHRELVIAQQAATRQVEIMRAQPFEDLLTTFGEDVDGNPFTLEVEGLSHTDTDNKWGSGTIIIDSTDPDLLDVEVKIEWIGAYGTTRFSAYSLYTD